MGPRSVCCSGGSCRFSNLQENSAKLQVIEEQSLRQKDAVKKNVDPWSVGDGEGKPRSLRYYRFMAPRKSREDAAVRDAPRVRTMGGAAGPTVIRRICRRDQPEQEAEEGRGPLVRRWQGREPWRRWYRRPMVPR